MKSLYRLLSVDYGFRSEHVLKLEMSLRTSHYDKDPAVIGFWQQTLDRVRALPGVESAAAGRRFRSPTTIRASTLRWKGCPC